MLQRQSRPEDHRSVFVLLLVLEESPVPGSEKNGHCVEPTLVKWASTVFCVHFFFFRFEFDRPDVGTNVPLFFLHVLLLSLLIYFHSVVLFSHHEWLLMV